jgi:hypothetical protein
MRRIFALLWATFIALGLSFLNQQDPAQSQLHPLLRVRDLKPDCQKDESAYLSAPVALASALGSLYVVDSQECEVRLFSREGGFLRVLGRRGQGPGEFNSPADIDFLEDKIYVSDRFNSRIQILDKNGSYLRSFRVPFHPDQICVLAPERIVVSQLPLGLNEKEKLIHCFNPKGEVLWAREDSYFSGDRVYDTFRNLAILNKGGHDDCYLIRKCNERVISHYDKDGLSLPATGVSPAYSFKKIALPLGGKKKELLGFCWDSVFYQDEFYFLAPEYTEDKDLGPGRQVFVLSIDGRATRVIELPVPVKKIALSEDRIFAIDLENYLRVFGIETR